ncbi:hypothetical protein C7446_1088 [Kushneria sinocarnis]|uniref:Uncharacterized protein n=1 Tax=Kushneria sinocarnis TaxID=595502 RepID=A0A420WYC2_9GAMM|nr:hypothetical protein [Kushneria sinocarnis]RKR06151.1 hypothetical protein C7446_1088 [Kushneria sinocarnis]
MSANQRGGHDVMLREDAAMRHRRKQERRAEAYALQALQRSLTLMPVTGSGEQARRDEQAPLRH